MNLADGTYTRIARPLAVIGTAASALGHLASAVGIQISFIVIFIFALAAFIAMMLVIWEYKREFRGKTYGHLDLEATFPKFKDTRVRLIFKAAQLYLLFLLVMAFVDAERWFMTTGFAYLLFFFSTVLFMLWDAPRNRAVERE